MSSLSHLNIQHTNKRLLSVHEDHAITLGESTVPIKVLDCRWTLSDLKGESYYSTPKRTPAPLAPDKETKLTLTPNNTSATPEEQKKLKKKKNLVIPAIMEAQPLPGFTTEDKSAWLIADFMNLTLGTEPPPGRMSTATDIIDLFGTLWRCFQGFFVEPAIVKCVYSESLFLINQSTISSRGQIFVRSSVVCSVSSLDDFERSPDFLGLQIQYNIQRIEDQQIQTWPLPISSYNF